jgi:hypothetical protein
MSPVFHSPSIMVQITSDVLAVRRPRSTTFTDQEFQKQALVGLTRSPHSIIHR